MWVFPASGDAGLSLGAALLCAADAGELSRTQIDHAYWGPEFGRADYEAALNQYEELQFREDVCREAAGFLAQGELVGWFQGRMELGPRALGNRSILADPRSTAMRDRVSAFSSGGSP